MDALFESLDDDHVSLLSNWLCNVLCGVAGRGVCRRAVSSNSASAERICLKARTYTRLHSRLILIMLKTLPVNSLSSCCYAYMLPVKNVLCSIAHLPQSSLEVLVYTTQRENYLG